MIPALLLIFGTLLLLVWLGMVGNLFHKGQIQMPPNAGVLIAGYFKRYGTIFVVIAAVLFTVQSCTSALNRRLGGSPQPPPANATAYSPQPIIPEVKVLADGLKIELAWNGRGYPNPEDGFDVAPYFNQTILKDTRTVYLVAQWACSPAIPEWQCSTETLYDTIRSTRNCTVSANTEQFCYDPGGNAGWKQEFYEKVRFVTPSNGAFGIYLVQGDKPPSAYAPGTYTRLLPDPLLVQPWWNGVWRMKWKLAGDREHLRLYFNTFIKELPLLGNTGARTHLTLWLEEEP